MQSGEPNDPVDVERFDKKSRLVGQFKKVRTREEVDFPYTLKKRRYTVALQC